MLLPESSVPNDGGKARVEALPKLAFARATREFAFSDASVGDPQSRPEGAGFASGATADSTSAGRGGGEDDESDESTSSTEPNEESSEILSTLGEYASRAACTAVGLAGCRWPSSNDGLSR